MRYIDQMVEIQLVAAAKLQGQRTKVTPVPKFSASRGRGSKDHGSGSVIIQYVSLLSIIQHFQLSELTFHRLDDAYVFVGHTKF